MKTWNSDNIIGITWETGSGSERYKVERKVDNKNIWMVDMKPGANYGKPYGNYPSRIIVKHLNAGTWKVISSPIHSSKLIIL